MSQLSDEVRRRFEATFLRGQTPWVRDQVPAMVARFADVVLESQPHPKLLDLGCGNGWLSLYLAQRGFRVEGIDGSATAIDLAEKALAQNPLDTVHFQVGDALDYPFGTAEFDAVFDRGFLHHVPTDDWDRYYGGLLRVLKPRGWFYLETFSDNSVNKKGFTPKVDGGMEHVSVDESGLRTLDRFFSPASVRALFGADFDLIEDAEDDAATANASLMRYFILRRV